MTPGGRGGPSPQVDLEPVVELIDGEPVDELTECTHQPLRRTIVARRPFRHTLHRWLGRVRRSVSPGESGNASGRPTVGQPSDRVTLTATGCDQLRGQGGDLGPLLVPSPSAAGGSPASSRCSFAATGPNPWPAPGGRWDSAATSGGCWARLRGRTRSTSAPVASSCAAGNRRPIAPPPRWPVPGR